MNDDTLITVKLTAVDADSLKDAKVVKAEIVGDTDAVLNFIAAATHNTGAQATVQQLQ